MASLHNKFDRKLLKEQMKEDDRERITLSFYKYAKLEDPNAFRDWLYERMDLIGALGRIYVATEGINAQMCVPKDKWSDFEALLSEIPWMEGVHLNIAIEDEAKSFYMLKILTRKKILADGLEDLSFDVTDKGTHLSAKDFNEITDREDVTIVDMRNHYEAEVGHFENAICPDVDTFRQSLPLIEKLIQNKKQKPLVMYCTGGIRCEKASAWFRHRGFEDVYQLKGGIIEYHRQVEKDGLQNKFRGKNFVFDERLGERVNDEIIAHCHQCGKPSDHHTNCKNEACHLLFIQCEECASKFEACCSEECMEVERLPEAEKIQLRKGKKKGRNVFRKGRFREQHGKQA